MPTFEWLELLRSDLARDLASADRFGVARALILSAKVDPERLELIRWIGLVHITSAAGIHLWLIYISTEAGVRRLVTQLGITPRGDGWIVVWRWAALGVWALLWGLAGLRVGMMRPLVLIALKELARVGGWRWSPFTALGLALGLDCAAEWIVRMTGGDVTPFMGRLHYALSVGGAVVGWLAIARRGESGGRPSLLESHLAITLGSWLPIALLEIVTTGWVKWTVPILNLVSYPLVVWPLYALGLPAYILFRALGHASEAAQVLEWITLWVTGALDLMIQSVLSAQDLGPAIQNVGLSAAIFGMALAALMALIIRRIGPRSDRFWAMAGTSCVILAFAHYVSLGAGKDLVIQLDVGQGDAALWVDSMGAARMIDVGSSRAGSPARWLDRLGGLGVLELHSIAITHLDEDHVGGLMDLMPVLPIGRVCTSKGQLSTRRGDSLIESAQAASVRVSTWDAPCGFPSVLQGAEVRLSPRRRRKKAPQEIPANQAMNGIAIRLTDGRWWLSLGDADKKQELRWIDDLGRMIGNDPVILKVSHHGSKTSSAPELLQSLNIQEAWISAGLFNRYGHPAPGVMAEYRRQGIPTRATLVEGNLSTRAGKPKIPVRGAGGPRRPQRYPQ